VIRYLPSLRHVRVSHSFLPLVLSCFRYLFLNTSSTLVRLAGFRLIEAGLPEDLDVDSQHSLSRCVAVWDIERRPKCSHLGLVHMLQLASKTGTTLAGKVFPFPRNRSYSPVTRCVTLLFLDCFILRLGKIRIGLHRVNIRCEGARCYAAFHELPVTHFHALTSLSNASEMQMTPKIFIDSL
jgi:hypothetical protein